MKMLRQGIALLLLATSAPVLAQGTPVLREGGLPAAVAGEVAAAWNAAGARRITGPYTVATGDTVRGTLVIRDGPLIVQGMIDGAIVAINSDVQLVAGSRVAGPVTVVGGLVDGRAVGRVDGDIRVWRASLRYTEIDGQLTPEEPPATAARFSRFVTRDNQDLSDFLVTSAHTYNRVEGLPMHAGPRLRLNRGNSQVHVEALGIFRTGDRLAWEAENLGHRLFAEVRQGSDERHVAVGGRLYDEIEAVETWSLGETEVALASFLFARDYRDYYNRHGGHAFVRAAGEHGTRVTLSAGRERWGSRDARDPFTLFQRDREWRANPRATDAITTLVGLQARLDTRNDRRRPLAGWFLNLDYERGAVRPTPLDPTSLALLRGPFDYGRLFLDFRRYNRIAPQTAVNVRLVAGGLLHGDELPAQRRLSVSGVDALPGYGFRQQYGVLDVGMCNTSDEIDYAASGRPALCDRILLAQVEWRGDFRVALFGAKQGDGDRRFYTDGVRADGSFVIFANAGRGWRVGEESDGLIYGRASIPRIGTFRSDLGAGVDFGLFGLYVAQPLSEPREQPRLFVRVGQRF